MTELLSMGFSALANVLALLGMGFILSRGFGILRSLPDLRRKIVLGIAFSAMGVASMMMSFPMGPGIIGDLRNVVIAVAALVGGPISALIAAAATAAFRTQLGGHWGAAVLGIAMAAALSVAFVQSKLLKTPRNLVLFGVVLAIVNASLPLIALISSSLTLREALAIGATVLAFAVVAYPLAIALLGTLLRNEQRRSEEEAELKIVNAALSLESVLTHGVFERTGVAMAWSDLKTGYILRANPEFASFTGYSEAELAGKRFDSLSVPEDRQQDLETLKPFVAGTRASLNDERRYLRKDGTIVWGMRSLTAVREGDGSWHCFAMVQDITERKRAREEIAYLASHDSLTGLVNRLTFFSELTAAIECRRPADSVAVLYLDLDDFKEINDRLGHPVGDTILVELGKRLRDCVAKGDIVARFGGDEFAVLRKASTTVGELEDLAKRMVTCVREPLRWANDVFGTEVSIGIARGPRDGLDAENLMRRADMALYVAKADQGSTYKFFEPDMEEQRMARQALKIDLNAALSNNEFEIDYQPIVDLRTGDVTSFEALLRWRHPRRGRISPADFIPLAEETGLIVPIGEWVLSEACKEAMGWPSHVGVSVNVSTVQFAEPALASRVRDMLVTTGFSAHRLELEITESVILHDSNDNLQSLRELRALGVRIALDDFGTGYSALSYLQRFPFDRIKIDRSFVMGTERHEAEAVVRAVIDLGHSLNMRITAEGVETQSQFDRIMAKGCDEAQGFLISRPVPPQELQALITKLSAGRNFGSQEPHHSRLRKSVLLQQSAMPDVKSKTGRTVAV